MIIDYELAVLANMNISCNVCSHNKNDYANFISYCNISEEKKISDGKSSDKEYCHKFVREVDDI